MVVRKTEMVDTEIAPFLNRLGYMLLAEVDSLDEVEDQLWSLQSLLMRLKSFLMEVERKQNEDLEKFVVEVVTVVHEAEKVTVSYLDTAGKFGLVMDEAHKLKSKISGFISKIRGMMESHVWFHRFSEPSTSNTSSLSKRGLPPTIEDGDAIIVLEDEVKRMMNLLKDEDPDGRRDIIPVVGPGGMGKTTFVRNIYDDPTIMERFPCRAWIPVSNNYKIEELLQYIIEQIKPATTTTDSTKDDDQINETKDLKDLAIETYKHLKNSTRYLVVFDDVCQAQLWADINMVFPAKNKRESRIILITRHDQVASHARPSRPPFYLRRLSKEEGRTLFSKRVISFVDSHSHAQWDPNHLHSYHELVDACGGLPLAIVSLAAKYHRRLLSKTDNENNEESWSDKILPLGICEYIYNGLPRHLKMCLAYYHVLKKGYHFFDYKGLVVAEGLVNPSTSLSAKIGSGDQTSGAIEMEDITEEYLNELMNMNLIKVQRGRIDGHIKEITIPRECYSLLDLCRFEAASSKMNKLEGSSLFINCSSGSETEETILQDMKLIIQDDIPLRVFDLKLDSRNPCFINLIHLRYLRLEIIFFSSEWKLFCLSNLHNLQFVKMKLKLPLNNFGYIDFPLQFWKMRQLRHFLLRLSSSASGIPVNPSLLIEPKVNSIDWQNISLKNLLTLEGLDTEYFTEDVLYTMPNLVTLRLHQTIPKFDDRLGRVFPLMERLRKLSMVGGTRHPIQSARDIQSKLLIFPPNITHLTLKDTGYEEECFRQALRSLQMLQNLHILKLQRGAMFGSVLDFGSNIDGFRQLKILELKDLRIREWKMSVGVTPSLQKLTVISCERLNSLPLVALKAISTLQELELLGDHEDRVLRDARLIEEHVGKDRLKLCISYDAD
ncbi:hypothetical protein NE237_016768 [Protea cynaroides]|uniref:Uncharacterized protein n=1 Tax=Protea cynaroides TaxID=273540 RepID=A0A9Q0HFF0_9MAGN|nr:hypothetical protein NE237_016768 [Protea cynaroides]